ncbi:MAG TPA: hypothetical protein VHN14_19105, partial [Kofleriaceae bacterium]|nr:hypothetical protein [Kofleriaceae bacterium]
MSPTRRRRLLWIAALAALAAAPLVLDSYASTMLTRILVFALFAASLDLLVGVTGLPSLGHGAYFGAGAYAAGWVALHISRSAPVTLAAAVAVSALVAAVAGSVAVRARGVFFLMLTLAIGEIIEQLAHSWQSVTGGSDGLYGIPTTQLAGTALGDVRRPADVHLGRGQEDVDADVDEQAALDLAGDQALDLVALLVLLHDLAPFLLALGLAVGEHDGARLVLDGVEEHLHLVADLRRDDPVGAFVVPLLQGDDALGLVADV